ncbi:MAG: 3-oxoacyl-[acyl-carrier protein] reductase, partial [Rhodothermales bacterium]
KHAMIGLSKVIAAEGQAHGIRAAVISPGGVATEMVRQARPDLDISTLIQPEDVARAVLYLANEPESCCTDFINLRRSGATPFP